MCGVLLALSVEALHESLGHEGTGCEVVADGFDVALPIGLCRDVAVGALLVWSVDEVFQASGLTDGTSSAELVAIFPIERHPDVCLDNVDYQVDNIDYCWVLIDELRWGEPTPTGGTGSSERAGASIGLTDLNESHVDALVQALQDPPIIAVRFESLAINGLCRVVYGNVHRGQAEDLFVLSGRVGVTTPDCGTGQADIPERRRTQVCALSLGGLPIRSGPRFNDEVIFTAPGDTCDLEVGVVPEIERDGFGGDSVKVYYPPEDIEGWAPTVGIRLNG